MDALTITIRKTWEFVIKRTKCVVYSPSMMITSKLTTDQVLKSDAPMKVWKPAIVWKPAPSEYTSSNAKT
jgi:hypothetical protein